MTKELQAMVDKADADAAARKQAEYHDLPPEFIQYIEFAAYERGHSAGQGEVDAIAASIASDLKPYIKSYTKRINP
jgi:hypothetical protein